MKDQSLFQAPAVILPSLFFVLAIIVRFRDEWVFLISHLLSTWHPTSQKNRYIDTTAQKVAIGRGLLGIQSERSNTH
jgi:hypothetical protein